MDDHNDTPHYVYHYITILLNYYLFLKDTLRNSELDEAERSSTDIANLFHSKSLAQISALDLNASLENFQEVIIYDEKEEVNSNIK